MTWFTNLKARFWLWYNSRFIKGFWKAWTWLLSAGGFVLAILPDLINMVLANIEGMYSYFPEMSLKNKFTLLAVITTLNLLLRGIRQKRDSIKIAEPVTPATQSADASGG